MTETFYFLVQNWTLRMQMIQTGHNISYSSIQFIIVIYSANELSRRVSTLLKGLIRRKE